MRGEAAEGGGGSGDKVVLLVEEDPSLGHALELLLEGWGFRILSYREWWRAGGALRATRPSVVLIDIDDASEQALRFYRGLALEARDGGIPVLLLAADEEEAEWLGQTTVAPGGAYRKPVDLVRLREDLQRLTGLAGRRTGGPPEGEG